MRRACVALACLPALLAAGAWGRAACAAELQIEAPRFSFDEASHTYTYEDGRLTLGELRLFASHLVLNTATGKVHASGYIRIQTPSYAGIADSLELDAGTRVGTFHGASLHSDRAGLYLRAETVQIFPDGHLELQSCTITACSPGVPVPWSLSASSASVEQEGLGVAWNPRLFMGPVPVLYLPVLVWPTVSERQTGVLTPRLTDDTASLPRYDVGWRLQVPVFLNLGYDQDLTLIPEPIQRRGLGLGAEYNYAFWDDQRGKLTLFGIKERKARNPADENDILPAGETPPASPLSRYRADWGHNQGLGESTRLVLNYHDSSDGQVRSEYDRISEYRPFRTYQASVSTQWPWADAALTVEQNADFLDESVYATGADDTDLRQRPQLMPRLITHLGGQPLGGTPLALSLGLSATRFEAPQAVSGQLLEALPTLSLPLSLGGAFELRPALTRHLVSYSALEDGSGGGTPSPLEGQSFGQTEATVELRTALARVYELQDSRYAALKHRIVPRLIYTQVQDVPQPLADQVLRSRVAERLVTLRLDNQLLGRGNVREPSPLAAPDLSVPAEPAPFTAPPGPVSQLLQLDLIQRYDLLLQDNAPTLRGPTLSLRPETGPGEPLLPLLLEVTAYLGRFTANAEANYHHQLHRTTEMSLGLHASAAPGATLSFSYGSNEFSYVTPENKEVAAGSAFYFGGSKVFTDRWSGGFSGRINLSDGTPPLDRRLDQSALYLDYRPDCYGLRASYRESVVAVPQGGAYTFYVDRSFKLIFDLSGLVGGASRAPASPSSAPSFTAAADDPPPAHCHS
jgi:LPS transport system D